MSSSIEISAMFDELRNSHLNSVEFVMDYLQLRFDGPCLNVTNPLTVRSKETEIKSWDIGFRDLLCRQIGKIVHEVTYKAGKELNIRLVDNSEISISLYDESCTSPEAIYCHGF